MNPISSAGKGALVVAGACSLVSSYRDYQADEKTRAFLKAAFGVACLAVAYQWGDAGLESVLPQEVDTSPLQNIENASTTPSAPACPLDQLNQILEEGNKQAGNRTCLSYYFDALAQSKEGLACSNYIAELPSTGHFQPKEVSKALSWTLYEKMPSIVVKHQCPNGDVGVSSIFQIPYSHPNPNEVITNGIFRAKCFFVGEVCDAPHFHDITSLFRLRETLFNPYTWEDYENFASVMQPGEDPLGIGRIKLTP